MVNVTIKEAVSPSMRKIQKRLKWFLALNVLALLDTGYLIYLHYKPTATEWCKFGEKFDCDIVNKSIYAEIFDIPVAVLGFGTYLILFALAWVVRKKISASHQVAAHGFAAKFSPGNLLWLMFALTAIGVLFSGYLTYIELFVLGAICIFCIVQQIIILADFGLLLSMLRLSETRHPFHS